MTAVNFPNSPTNGQTFISGGVVYTHNTTKGYWDGTSIMPEGGDISVYSTLANMPLSGVADDTLAKVLDTNKLYKWTGTGWYFLDPVNTNPNITTGGDATYALAVDGTPTVVTLEANDPEGFPITWNYAVTTGSLGSTATVSQSNNVFTITPSTVEANAGEFTITFTASDGVNLDTSASEFTLAFAAGWAEASQQAKIQASDAEFEDYFGGSVAISSDGSTAIVGAEREDTGGTDAGAAYIFTRSGTTWSQQAKIQSSDIAAVDYFGNAVAISSDGNTVVVGARYESAGGANAGAAYIFTRSGTTWSQQAKILSSDIAAGDYFGGSQVSMSNDGNTVIISAHNEGTGGAAYIFTRSGTTWSQQAKIVSSDIQSNDQFGRRVSIAGDGNTAIVGAFLEDTGGTSTGSAYIFTKSGTTWSQQAKIQSSDIETVDNFGIAVAMSNDGNTVVVGAHGEDTGGSNAGAAYIFTRSGTTWSQQAKILSSDIASPDTFGTSASISGDGDTAIVGARRETGDTGAAYIFKRSGTTWSQKAKIVASDGAGGDDFAFAVAISNDSSTAIVGANSEDTVANKAGAAYIFIKQTD